MMRIYKTSLLKHRAATVMLLIAGLAVLGLQAGRLAAPQKLAVDDFVAYWAAGRLNLAGSNPYGPEDLMPLQRAEGWGLERPDMIWNPPWALPLMMPFGLLGYSAGRALWLLANLAVVLLCCGWSWGLYGGAPQRRWLAPVAGLSFVPTILVLRMGQIGPMMLLGVVGFLYFWRRDRGWAMGACAALVAIKPQLLHLFWIGLLLWSLHRRRLVPLFGLGATLIAASAVAMLPNREVFEQYVYTVTHYPPDYWATPTPGALLRILFGGESFWLQFVPPAISTVWFTWYWWRRREQWDWLQEMPLVLLVSLASTSHGWEYDLVVLVPAVMAVCIGVNCTIRWQSLWPLVATYLAINGLAMTFNILRISAFWYIWLAPSLFGLFLLIERKMRDGVPSSGRQVAT